MSPYIGTCLARVFGCRVDELLAACLEFGDRVMIESNAVPM